MKKTTKKVTKAPVKEVKTLFYMSKDKFERAHILVGRGEFKTVKEAYLSLGGAIGDHGYAEV